MRKKKIHKCCILLSGGTGSRMKSSIPKQYIEVHGRMIFEYTLQSILSWKGMDGLIVVADKTYHSMLEHIIRQYISDPFLGFAEPGENRQGSIINALNYLSDCMARDSVVMVHDAVRPLVSQQLLDACDSSLNNAEGVMPYIELKDTVYESKKSGKNFIIDRNIDRDTLVAGQTPEFFRYEKYKKCCESLTERELSLIHGSTEPAVLGGMKIALIPGEEGNFKITTPADLDRFREIVEERGLYRNLDLGSGKRKKTILYCINTASIIYYEDEMLDKIKKNFEIFSESADGIRLLWTVDQNSDEKFKLANRSLKRKFNNLLKKNRFTDYGRYVDYKDAEILVDEVDAYYGDWNYFAWKCQQLGKPVMIQNIEV